MIDIYTVLREAVYEPRHPDTRRLVDSVEYVSVPLAPVMEFLEQAEAFEEEMFFEEDLDGVDPSEVVGSDNGSDPVFVPDNNDEE